MQVSASHAQFAPLGRLAASAVRVRAGGEPYRTRRFHPSGWAGSPPGNEGTDDSRSAAEHARRIGRDCARRLIVGNRSQNAGRAIS